MKNRLRKEMGRSEGEEREIIVEEYKKWRSIVKNILSAKKINEQTSINKKLENLRGSGEKNYWKCFKEILGMNKKEERVPEEVWEGEELVRGGRVKQVWNAAFSKLGKFDLNDKKFDRKKYEEVRKKLEQYERNVQSKVVEELDAEITEEEVERAIRKLRNGKAAGVDSCVNEILKNGGEGMKNSLLLLFQSMWRRPFLEIGPGELLFPFSRMGTVKRLIIIEVLPYLV